MNEETVKKLDEKFDWTEIFLKHIFIVKNIKIKLFLNSLFELFIRTLYSNSLFEIFIRTLYLNYLFELVWSQRKLRQTFEVGVSFRSSCFRNFSQRRSNGGHFASGCRILGDHRSVLVQNQMQASS